MTFATGQVLVYRNTHRSRVSVVRPVRVVSDDDRGLLIWLAQGSESRQEVAADGRGSRSMPFSEWITQTYELRPAEWQGPGILMFFPPDADHSVWWFWDENGQFEAWYVNLEKHIVRWDDGAVAGIDIVDQDLDVVVAPDRSWEWKDEDEFAERLAFPDHYWVPDEAAVRAEGRRVIKMAEAGEFPFDGAWIDYRPDPSWLLPVPLPEGWDRPVAAHD
jgi:protein associated with RNAse G/E